MATAVTKNYGFERRSIFSKGSFGKPHNPPNYAENRDFANFGAWDWGSELGG